MKNKNENFKDELENQYTLILQNNQKKEDERYKILLTIVIITLVTTIVSSIISIRSLSHTKEINDYTKNEENLFQTIEVTYNGDQYINIEKIKNKQDIQAKEITITNNGTTDVTYNLKLSSIKTSLTTNNSLSYTLIENNDIKKEEPIALNEKELAKSVVISPQSTIKYTIYINYKDLSELTDNDYYFANIVIDQSKNETIKEN